MEQENKYVRSLIDNARRGKLGALEELFEMCLADIFTLIIRLTGDKKLAESFTIDTLVDAWKEIKKQAPEYISFENWLRNIAIKVTICGLIGSKECDNKFRKQSSADDNEREAFSTDPLENAIAGLDDKSRAIFVLNKIDGKPLATFSGFLGVNKTDAENKLSDSVLNITNSLPNAESEGCLDTLVKTLPSKIQPDKDLLECALSEINEIRIKELKEKDTDSEELKELIEIQNNRNSVPKSSKKVEEVVTINKNKLKSSDKIIIIALLLISVVSFFLYVFTAANKWMLSSISGKPTKNNTPIVKMEEILSGDLISTDDVSAATIDISNIGRINISSNTSFKRLQEDNIAELHNGKLEINTLEADDYLYLVIPDATIEGIELGTRYSVDVDPKGISQIMLEKGWLRVKSGKDEIIFSANYGLKILNGTGVSVPYYAKSNLVQISLLENYLFNGKEEGALSSIIASSTEYDAILLWNLLKRVKPEHRESVYDKLSELVPHPGNIAKQDIISLDQKAMQGWLKEIKWYL